MLGSYLGVLLIFGSVLGFALVQMADTRSNLSSVVSGYMAMAREAERLTSIPLGYALGRDEVDWTRYRPSLDQMYLDRMQHHLGATVEHGAVLQGKLESPVEVVTLSGIMEQIEGVSVRLTAFGREQERLAVCVRGADPYCAADVAAVLGPQRAELSDELEILRTKLEIRIQSTLETAGASQMRASRRLLWLSSTAIALAGLMFLLVHLSLRPIERLTRGAQRIAEGRYGERVEVGTGDEIGKLADEFNRMAAALAQREKRLVQMERLATIGRMSAQVAHEIRNPLNALGLNAELLGDELSALPEEPRQEAAEVLARLQAEIDRLAQVTETYLSLARMPSPERVAGDLPDLVRRVVDFLSDELAQAHIALELEVAADLPAVPMDEGQVRQALLNLLRNAVEAQPDGGEIHIAVAPLDGGVELVIADRGPGIEPSQREAIFDPFVSTKELGTGLGLAITRQIVEAHGGTIHCTAVDEGGAALRIRLPLDRGKPA